LMSARGVYSSSVSRLLARGDVREARHRPKFSIDFIFFTPRQQRVFVTSERTPLQQHRGCHAAPHLGSTIFLQVSIVMKFSSTYTSVSLGARLCGAEVCAPSASPR
jgi:hypothetical protein